MARIQTEIRINNLLRGKQQKQIYHVFSALGNPSRFFIFRLIAKNEEVCVSDIAKKCKISVSAASQHLKILEQSGLVFRTRDKRNVCYSINRFNSAAHTIVQIALS